LYWRALELLRHRKVSLIQQGVEKLLHRHCLKIALHGHLVIGRGAHFDRAI
jgi:hypothetical protein